MRNGIVAASFFATLLSFQVIPEAISAAESSTTLWSGGGGLWLGWLALDLNSTRTAGNGKYTVAWTSLSGRKGQKVYDVVVTPRGAGVEIDLSRNNKRCASWIGAFGPDILRLDAPKGSIPYGFGRTSQRDLDLVLETQTEDAKRLAVGYANGAPRPAYVDDPSYNPDLVPACE